MRSISPATKLALAAMSTALSVLALYVASFLNTSRLFLASLTSLMLWIPMNEKKGVFYAFLSYLATGALAFLLIPDKLYFAAYATIFGPYGFIQYAACKLTSSKPLSFFLEMLGCNILAGIALLVFSFVMNMDIPGMLSDYSLPIWLLIILLEAAFAVYILLYSFFTRVFDKELRKKLITRG